MSRDPIMSETVPCLACREPIQRGASVCKECGAHQDWRRHLNFSGTILSLLVALVSVTSIGVPWIVEAVEAESSELHASVVRTGEYAGSDQWFDAQLLVANTGTRPGTLGHVHFRASPQEPWAPMDIPSPWMDKSIEIVPPGGSGFVYLSRFNDQGQIVNPKSLPDAFEISVELIEFDMSRDYVVVTYTKPKRARSDQQ